jgi:ERCC4-type nuclease
MILKIDCKETDLVKHINYLIETIPLFNDLKIETCALPLGDALIEDENNETKLIIERKTINDLMSSIKDGRYDEQSYRLSANDQHNHNIIYLIEGDINNTNRFRDAKIDKLTIYSTIISLNYYKGFSVIRTFNLEESAIFILNSLNKLNKEKNKKKPYYSNENIQSSNEEITCKDYVNVVKKVKKENITPENINEIMLSQMPGISSTTAIAILNKFKTIPNIISELSKDPNCLKDVTYVNKQGQTRKINKTIGETLKKYLVC